MFEWVEGGGSRHKFFVRYMCYLCGLLFYNHNGVF